MSYVSEAIYAAGRCRSMSISVTVSGTERWFKCMRLGIRVGSLSVSYGRLRVAFGWFLSQRDFLVLSVDSRLSLFATWIRSHSTSRRLIDRSGRTATLRVYPEHFGLLTLLYFALYARGHHVLLSLCINLLFNQWPSSTRS